MICEDHKIFEENEMMYGDIVKHFSGEVKGPQGVTGWSSRDYNNPPQRQTNMEIWHPNSQFRKTMTHVLGPNFDILFNYCHEDSDYYGPHKLYKCETACISVDENFSAQTFYELLLDNNVELLKIGFPEWSLLRHVDNEKSMSEYTPASNIVHIKIKLNDHVFALYLRPYGRHKHEMHELCSLLKAMDSKSPNYKLYSVQSAIDKARMRVLGDKYNREFMFTRLL